MSKPEPKVVSRAPFGSKEILLLSHSDDHGLLGIVGYTVIVRENGKDSLHFEDKQLTAAQTAFDVLSRQNSTAM